MVTSYPSLIKYAPAVSPAMPDPIMATFNLIFHLILKILKFFETFIIDGKGSIFFYLSLIELMINMTHLKK